jgi:hypothetical protein
MTPSKLDKIKREIARLRRAPQKAAALESVAKRLGRKKVKRGKEPVWESELEELYPLSIPHHGGGRDLSVGTQRSILDSLEDDVLAWEERFPNEDNEEYDDEKSEDEDSDESEGGDAK